MNKILMLVLICCMTACGGENKSYDNGENDVVYERAQAIINESILDHNGNCACPYNTASDGSVCGDRSAYSRSGGKALYCYFEDIPDEVFLNWVPDGKNNQLAAELDCMVISSNYINDTRTPLTTFRTAYEIHIYDKQTPLHIIYSWADPTTNMCQVTY